MILTNSLQVSKHGTLNEHDVQDVREIDIDQVLQHRNSASTSHLFGKTGYLPPEDAVAVERRYTRYWSLEGENGQDFVALNKANSSTKGRFHVSGLAEGEYKLVMRLLKSQNVLNYATIPLGVILGGVSSLVAAPDKREETFARGMPTDYVEIFMRVGTEENVIMEQRIELDQGIDSFTRVFTVRAVDAESKTDLSIECNSFSLVKRMRIQADLFRCDLPKPSMFNRKEKAAQGRKLVVQAFSSGSAPPAPSRSAPAAHRQPAKPKRSVFIRDDVPVSKVLVKFYTKYAPDKVSEVNKIIEHFLTRDKHLGVLFATLEDKYGVRFNENGEWR